MTNVRNVATRHLLALAAVLASGCTTERAYEGPPLAADERAIVRADPVVSAGAPVQVRLRQVDDREVGLAASQVELAPGKHAFLVDCRIAESGVGTPLHRRGGARSGRALSAGRGRHCAKL